MILPPIAACSGILDYGNWGVALVGMSQASLGETAKGCIDTNSPLSQGLDHPARHSSPVDPW